MNHFILNKLVTLKILELKCGTPSQLSNGLVRPTKTAYSAGETVTYHCSDPQTFDISTELNRTCQVDGSWSGLQPHCLKRTSSSNCLCSLNLCKLFTGNVIKNLANDVITLQVNDQLSSGADIPCHGNLTIIFNRPYILNNFKLQFKSNTSKNIHENYLLFIKINFKKT